MVCPSCGAENKAGRKFCSRCGAGLALVCAACGAPNDADDAFCGDCGSPLGAKAAAPPEAHAPPSSPSESAAERRLVSVLFADLVGFTTLSETRDSEEVRELLSRYFESSRRLIELYGGTVEKFIGDAVMAVWGTPIATEDDAERAVRAGLDLVAAVSALGQEVGAEELRARAGVLTGEAAVTIGAEGQGMVAGDLVNTASRVQSVAEPGSVYVGESTRRATEQTIVFEEAGTFELKGKEDLVPLWKALRVVAGSRGTLKSQGLEAPFVGRDRELRQIKDRFHASADEKKAHLVSITGIAGIGKSRLAWEFYKYFDGLAQTTYWHRGRCLAYGEGVTYWALADMVRMRCRISEDEEPASAQQKLRAALEEHILDAEERRFVEPRLAQLLGLGGELESTDRQDLFAAWRLFFERLAEVYPTVLAFEDMQWADASLLDFVEYLLEWARNSPLFVVTLARPELTESRPGWGSGPRNFTSLYLEPLQEAAMDELLTGLVPGLQATLRQQILARAEGVPLYAVETVRMLLDRGLLVQEGSAYRPVGEIDSLDVPETLHALIAARLDGLSPEERRLLQEGSVLGKTFTQPALAAMTGLTGEELEALLRSLVRKEVLGLQADPRSPEYGQYGFLQDLVRHVAYETLSKRERRSRHVAAAEHLTAALPEDEVAEVVASHLLEAYRLAPDAPEAAELKARARQALVRAGERASSLAGIAEALRYFEQAAALAEEPTERASLTSRAGHMASFAGRPVEARALLEEAHAAYTGEGLSREAALVSARLAEVDFMEGHLRTAVARLEPALDVLRDAEPDADVAHLAQQIGRCLVLNGEHERAAPHLEYALELASALDLPEVLAHALSSRGILLMIRDRLYEAIALQEAAVALALEHDRHEAALRAYANLAEAIGSSDQPVRALEVIDRGLELCRRVGSGYWLSTLLIEAIVRLELLGRWDDALGRVGEAVEVTTTAYGEMNMLGAVGVHCGRGEIREARALLDQLAAAGASDDPQTVAAYGAVEARVLRLEGKPTDALAAAERALEVRRQVGNTSWQVKAAFVEALESALALGDTLRAEELLAEVDSLRPGELAPFLGAQRARFAARVGREPETSFAAAIEGFRRIETPFYLGVTLLEQSEWLAEQGRADEGEPLLAEAREIFERLGAIPWLERAGQAVAEPEPVAATP